MVSGMGMVVKPGAFSARFAASGLDDHPIPELWAAVVAMPLYIYIKTPYTPTKHRLTRFI